MVLQFLVSEKHGIYNIGSGRAETWNHLARSIFKALGKTPVIDYIDMPESISKSYQYYTKAEMDKLRKNGYSAEITPLENAVADYVQNYLLPEKRLGA
jgi:ADP-L-glycero-D-manno-heptose 6-epimerase